MMFDTKARYCYDESYRAADREAEQRPDRVSPCGKVTRPETASAFLAETGSSRVGN